MPRRRVLVVPLLAAALASPLLPAPALAGPGRSPSDSLFPGSGNTGYDVRHYDVALSSGLAGSVSAARVAISAVATAPLGSFHLDYEGPAVSAVTVDGAPATTDQRGSELVVTPASPITDGARFTTVVTYSGTPPTHTDPDGSTEGWVTTSDGAIALGEPVGTATWLPSDNTPADKATYAFHLTAPSLAGYAAVANGRLVGTTTDATAGTTTWTWRSEEPMATYLATIAFGRFTTTSGSYRSIDGRRIPLDTFVDAQQGAPGALGDLPTVLRAEERWFGPYPFDAAGGIVDDASVGYALETQTRPFYPVGGADTLTVVHETAHQWFGDSATLADWHDIWLAEGFATYAEWLWTGAHGGMTPAQHFAKLYVEPASSSLWSPAPRRFTDPADLFGRPVYERGAMALQALRRRIGARDFATLLHRWAAAHRHGTVHTAAFVRLAEQVSGRRVAGLLHTWLDVDGKPSGY